MSEASMVSQESLRVSYAQSSDHEGQLESPFLDEKLFQEMEGAAGEDWKSTPNGYEFETPFLTQVVSSDTEIGALENEAESSSASSIATQTEVIGTISSESDMDTSGEEEDGYAEPDEEESLEAFKPSPTFEAEIVDYKGQDDLERGGKSWLAEVVLDSLLRPVMETEAAFREAFAAIEAGAQEATAWPLESWEEREGPNAAPHPAGISPLAIPAKKQWDARDRPTQWIGRVYGLVVHTTGSGLPSKARKRKISHTVAAVDHYTSSHGCHYVNGWKGAAGGDLLQVANEREQAAGVGMRNKAEPGKDQTLSIQRGRFEQDLPQVLVKLWRKRWPNYRHPLDLLPGTRSANVCYIHMECVPCVYHHEGRLITDDQPMRSGLRFTQAQHDTVAQLAVDIARRNGWPADETWWRTPRLLGHEDLAPIARHDSRGGWDPGYLREKPYFDWDYVYEGITKILRGSPQAPQLPAPGRVVGASIFAPLGALLDRFRSLLASGQEVLAVGLAYQSGVRDVDKLSNLIFFAHHPDLSGRKIQPHEKEFAREWLKIRDTLVKPALALLTRRQETDDDM